MHANEVVALDARDGSVLFGIYVGSDPGSLAISDDETTLYVALDGAAAVRRVDLTSRTAGREFTLGFGSFGDTLHAGDIDVMPGGSDLLVVGVHEGSPRGYSRGVKVFDDGVLVSESMGPFLDAYAIEAASPTRIYAYNNRSTGFDLRELLVDGATIVESYEVSDLFSGFDTDIQLHDGLLYGTDGKVVDPSVPRRMGSYAASGALAVDVASDRVFFLASDVWDDVQSLASFELSTFRGVRTLDIEDRGYTNAGRLFFFAPDRFVMLMRGDRFDDAPGRLVSFQWSGASE